MVQSTTASVWDQLTETLRHDPTPIGPAGLNDVFSGLQRPESVLTHASGRVFVSDRRGGVLTIQKDGTSHLSGTSTLLPNGIALLRDGAFLVANLSESGGIWRVAPDGVASPWLMHVEGRPMDRVNFVMNDAAGRVWACISASDGGDQYPLATATGYIVLHDASGTRIVAEGLHYTNECRISPDGQFLYVNETFGRCLSRFRLSPTGALSGKETWARFEAGDFPDGLTLDSEGAAWVVCVGSNRVYRVSPDGRRHTVIDDAIASTVAALEAAFVAGTLNRPQLSSARGHRLRNITSLAFGGPDLRTVFMGCLAGDALATFRSPVAGLVPVHWHW